MLQFLTRVLGFRSKATSTTRTHATTARRRFQPKVEALETREVPSATLVNGRDINVGPDNSSPQELVNVRINGINTLFFSADEGIFGRELWMRQGNNAPQRVKDIRPGPEGSEPLQLTEVGNSLYFSADDGLHGRELWRAFRQDGKWQTRMVKDINPGADGSDPAELTELRTHVGGKPTSVLYFAATNVLSGRELWRSNGRGTQIVRDINPGAADSAPRYLTVAKVRQHAILINVLYFAADDGARGRELWRTSHNGQPAEILMDIRGGPEGSNPFNLTKVTPKGTRAKPNPADILFFGADDGNFGVELWRSQGRIASTFRVRDINPGAASSLLESTTTLMAEFNHQLLFAADDGSQGRELWRSRGVRGRAFLVKDINPGPESSNPTAQDHPLPKRRNLIFRIPGHDRFLFFGASQSFTGGEPWRTNGKPDVPGRTNTAILRDINVGPASSLIQNELVGIVFPDNSKRKKTILFAADDGFFGRELWRSTEIIVNPFFNTRRDETDINPGKPSSDPSDFEIVGGRVFFAADKALLGRELWQVV